jgi:hypothetical protein
MMREPLSKNAYRVRERFEAKHKPHPAYRRCRQMHPAYFKTQGYHTWGSASSQFRRGRAIKILLAGETYGEGDMFSLGLFPAPRRRGGYKVYFGIARYRKVTDAMENQESICDDGGIPAGLVLEC